jgi:hypothetical protein
MPAKATRFFDGSEVDNGGPGLSVDTEAERTPIHVKDRHLATCRARAVRPPPSLSAEYWG